MPRLLRGTVIATMTATSLTNPTYVIVAGAGRTFRVGSSSGLVTLVEATNFNYEIKSAQTLTVRATDADGVATTDSVLIVNIADVVENPDNYENTNLQATGATRNAITLTWSNDDYYRQFARQDRGSIVIGYGGVTDEGKLAVALDASSITLSGLQFSDQEYTITLQFYSADHSSGASAEVVKFSTTANNPAAFASTTGTTTIVIDENVGTENTTRGTDDIFGYVSATDPDGDAVVHTIDPASSIFDITSDGRIEVKQKTNFNHEQKASHTITLLATEAFSSEVTRQTVVISVANVVERPRAYEDFDIGFRIDGGNPDTQMTLRWDSKRYRKQFEREDRGSIVISYGTGQSTRAMMTVGMQDNELVLSGLSSPATYTLTLRFYSADGVYGDSTKRLVVSTGGNSVPRFGLDINVINAFAGTARTVAIVEPALDDEAVTYSISNKPAWITEVPPAVNTLSVVVANTAPKGSHLLTLAAVDASSNRGGDAGLAVNVIEPGLIDWQVEYGNIQFVYDVSGLCHPYASFADYLLVGISDHEDSSGANRLGLRRTKADCGKTQLTENSALYKKYGKKIRYAYDVDNSEPGRMRVVVPMPAGSFHFDFSAYTANDPYGSVTIAPAVARRLDWRVAHVTVTVSEGAVAAGYRLLTVTLDSANAVANPNWSVIGQSEKNVAVTPVSGSDTREAVVSLVDADTLVYRDSPEQVFARLTLLTRTDDKRAARQLAVETRLVVKVAEVPHFSFASAQYNDDGSVVTFRFANANCIRGLYEVEIVGVDTRSFAGCGAVNDSVSGPPGMHFTYAGDRSFELQITMAFYPLLVNRSITVRLHNLDLFSRTGVLAQGVLVPQKIYAARSENAGVGTTAQGTAVAVAAVVGMGLINPTYAIHSGAGTIFRIGASSGLVVLANATNFNYERKSSYTLTIRATGSDQATADAELILSINDIEEKPDDYAGHGFRVAGQMRTEVTLNWENTGYVQQFEQPDRGRIEVSYGLGGFAHTLTLDANASAARLVDLVPGIAYATTLRWFSADGISQDTPVVLAAVTAGTNTAPTFVGDLMYSRPENIRLAETAVGIALATVSATDAQDDGITYSIVGGDDARRFVIDPQSGVVGLLESMNLNHELKDSYTFMVGASDDYGAMTTAALALTITDVPEQPELPEQFIGNAVAGTALTITLSAASLEDDGRTIRYQIEQANGDALPSWLELDQVNGRLTLGTSAMPGTLTLRLRAVAVPAVAGNDQQAANERLFRLVINDASSTNNRPVFASGIVLFSGLATGVEYPAGHAVGTLVATDADSGDTLRYSLRGTALFEISDPVSGEVLLREAMTFTPAKTLFSLIADVDDGNGGLASTEVLVLVSNRARAGAQNTAPLFTMAREVYQVSARTMARFFVTPAADQEDHPLVPGYSAIVPAGGWLTFDRNTLGFTVQPHAPLGSHPVTVMVTDSGGLSAEHVFMVKVGIVGNQEPAFASAVVQVDYTLDRGQEMAESGTIVGAVPASDPDEGAVLVYQIVSGDPAGLFAIDANGQIAVAQGKELAEGTYRLMIEVNDGRGGFASVVVEVTVQPAPAAVAHKVVLMMVDRAIAVAAADLVQARLNASLPGYGTGSAWLAEPAGEAGGSLSMVSAQQQWDNWRYEREHDREQSKRMKLRDYIYERGFDLALAGHRSAGVQMRMWGSASRSSIDGTPKVDDEQVFYDGDVDLFMLGFEAGQSRTRLGIAVGRANAKVGLAANDGERLERQLASAHPYFSFQASDSIWLWAIGGFGKGDFINYAGDDQINRDARHVSAAGGVKSSWEYRSTELSAGIGALLVQSRMAADPEQSLAEMKESFWRANLDFVVGHPFIISPEWSLRPSLGAHLRRDSGADWLDASKIDASAGLSLNWSKGFSAQLSSRLQTNEGDTNERNISGRISYDFGSDGRGLLLEVAPRMSSSSAAETDRSLSGSASYGLPVRLFADAGLATLKADFASAEQGIVVDRYGFRFAGRRLDVDLAADGAGDSWRIDLKLR